MGVCVCMVAGSVVCACCVAVPGYRVEGDDVDVEVVGVCGVGRMMWGGVCCVDLGIWGCSIGRVLHCCVLGRFLSEPLCLVGLWDVGYVGWYVLVGGVSVL